MRSFACSSKPPPGQSRRRWRRWCLALCVMLGMSGCAGSRVAFVPESEGLVILDSDVRGHVYLWNGREWERSRGRVRLPAGWYAGSTNGF